MNVNELVHLLKVDRVTLQRDFKSEINISPSDYHQKQHNKRACKLLTMTDWPLSHVAKASSFANEKYFILCFKQAMGQTPGYWRSQQV